MNDTPRLTTMVPISHVHPVGTRVRYRHGQRIAEIIGVEFAYCGEVYRLRYEDNGQVGIRRIDEVEHRFDVIPPNP